MNESPAILLVDDSETDLFFMRAAFQKAGCKYPLQGVNDGEEAIAYLSGDGPFGNRAEFPLPSVMLLDLNMPKKSGFEVLAWVRAQPGLKRLTIMILSASTRTIDLERAFDLGANAFLVKPSTMEDLVNMVRCLRDWIQCNQFPSLGIE
jgi:CheY-like chemotaxis protein